MEKWEESGVIKETNPYNLVRACDGNYMGRSCLLNRMAAYRRTPMRGKYEDVTVIAQDGTVMIVRAKHLKADGSLKKEAATVVKHFLNSHKKAKESKVAIA